MKIRFKKLLSRLICFNMILFCSTAGSGVFAAEAKSGNSTALFKEDLKVESDFKNSKITLSGVFADNVSSLTVEILKSGCDFDTLGETAEAAESVMYADQIYFDKEEKNFDLTVKLLGQSAYLFGKINAQKDDVNDCVFKFKHINKDEYKNLADELNKSAKEDTFENFLTKYNNNLNVATDLTVDKSVDTAVAAKFVYDYLATADMDSEDPNNAQKIWDKAQFLCLLGGSSNIDFKTMSGLLGVSDKAEAEWLEVISANDLAQKRFLELFAKRNLSGISDLNNSVREVIMLTAVQYPELYSNIGKILTDFKDLTGITASNEYTIYSGLVGKEFDDKAALLSAYKALADSKSDEGYKGGSTGGSGGGGGGGGKNTNVSVGVSPDVSAAPLEITKKFKDLASVEWAYEAIMTLAGKNIINGKEAEIFAPHDAVTREEFVKILVCALNLQNETFENAFSDVGDDDWFVSYVNIAKDKNIVLGKGNGIFGTGEEISRQDMAVMIYNTLKYCGVEPEGEEPDFSDSKSISEYAKTAVGALCKMGVINGNDDGTFAPLESATRAEAAKMVFGIIGFLPTEVTK